MFPSIRDFLGTLSGYKQLYDTCEINSFLWEDTARECIDVDLVEAHDKIKRLELLVPHETPPKITYVTTRDSAWLQSRIDSMELGIIRLPLDGTYRLTNQSNFLNIVAWDWLDALPYISERFDCENFAIAFKSIVDLHFKLNQVGIVIDYQSGHAYNLVVYPDGNISVFEPQFDGLYLWSERITKFYSLSGAFVLL